MNNSSLEPSDCDVERPASREDIFARRQNSPNPAFVEMADAFLATILAGDEIVEFCTSRHSWRVGEGRAGYRLIRSGSVLIELLTRIN